MTQSPSKKVDYIKDATGSRLQKCIIRQPPQVSFTTNYCIQECVSVFGKISSEWTVLFWNRLMREMREMASTVVNASLLVVALFFSAVCGHPSDGSYAAFGGTKPTAPKGDDPVLTMFRNFMGNFPPYANPLNYIPAQAWGPYGPYPFSPGSIGQPNYGQWGVGYSGPYHGQGYGVPNPAYGGISGLDTRIAGGASGGTMGTDSAVVRTNDDGAGVSVSVQSPPDGKPIFRSKTVQGPNSYGTAFAYSSG